MGIVVSVNNVILKLIEKERGYLPALAATSSLSWASTLTKRANGLISPIETDINLFKMSPGTNKLSHLKQMY